MAVGLVFNRLVKLVHLPNVTGYVVAGVLFGPYVFNLLPAKEVSSLSIISDVALAFIAFSIGSSFEMSNLKIIGSKSILITILEACGGSAFVIAFCLIFGFPVPESLSLGAIAAATAPATTLLVAKQYKAKGPVTQMLLPVVAMDDAVCLILFSVLSSISAEMVNGTDLSVASMLLKPLKQIGLSLLIGAAMGFVVAFCSKLFKSRANRISVIIASLFFCTALADKLNLSQLLVCMMESAIMVNFSKEADKMLDVCDRWTPPVYIVFFVLSGASLNFKILPTVGLIGVIYVIARAVGKYCGATLGAAVTKADKNVIKYLGFTLLPQEGVAIGMSQLIVNILPKYGDEIRAVILCAMLVYELTGPILTKFALKKAGEITEPERKKKKETA